MLQAQAAFGNVNIGSSTTQTVTVTATAAGATSPALGTAIQVLTLGATGLDFGYVAGGSCKTSMMLTAGQSCTVMVSFKPIAPGQRMGAIVLLDGSATPVVLATAYIQGSGAGPLATHTPGLINTVAGDGSNSYNSTVPATATPPDGSSATSGAIGPIGMATDYAGNFYFASACAVRKVSAAGTITTVAGSASATSCGTTGDGGPATSAQLSPTQIALDGAGNLYIIDNYYCQVRRVTAATGIINTLAGGACGTPAGDGGPAANAVFSLLFGIAVDASANVYLVDRGGSAVRRITAATGTINTVAGTGARSSSTTTYCAAATDAFGDGCPAVNTPLPFPLTGVAVDPGGNIFFPSNLIVRRVDAVSGIITTVAGTGQTFQMFANSTAVSVYSGDGGPATSAGLAGPQYLALDAAGDLYLTEDGSYNRVRKVEAATGTITSIAGNGMRLNTHPPIYGDGGAATLASMYNPLNIVLDPGGDIYINDSGDEVVREIYASGVPLTFDTTNAGSTSVDSPQTTILDNIGTAPLIVSVPVSGANPSVPVGFSIGTASTCPQVKSSSTATSLVSGSSCTDLVSFSPTQAVAYSGPLATNDNSLNLGTTTSTALHGTGNPVNAPFVTSISPAVGTTAGGTAVILTGGNFTGVAFVSFGAMAASSFAVNSSTQITAVSPPGTLGAAVDITVATSSATSGANAGDVFTYIETFVFPTIPNPIQQGTSINLYQPETKGDLGDEILFGIVSGAQNPLTVLCASAYTECTHNAYIYNSNFVFTHAGSVTIKGSPNNAVNSTASYALQQVTETVQVQGQSVFVADSGHGSVAEFFSNGTFQSLQTNPAGVGAAVDNLGQLWSITPTGAASAVFKYNDTTLVFQGSYGGLTGATALAIDGNNMVWLANGNQTITVMNGSGTITSTVADSTLSNAKGVAIDLSGNVWIANSGNNSVDEVIGGAGPASPLTNAAVNASTGVRP